jgi:hypothetical protein
MTGLDQRLTHFERISPSSPDRKRAKNDDDQSMDTNPAAITPAQAGMHKPIPSELS